MGVSVFDQEQLAGDLEADHAGADLELDQNNNEVN